MKIINDEIVEFDVEQTTLIVPENVNKVAIKALANYVGNAIKEVFVAKGNKTFCVKNNCLIDVANNVLVLAGDNAIIPADGSVTAIGDYAFHRHEGLKSIEIPPAVKTIGYMAFAATGLKQIYIPKTVDKIYSRAFALNSEMDISVDKENSDYYVQSGCLIERKTDRLIASFGEDVVVPNCVKSIDEFFFSFAKHKSITISFNVTKIAENAFDMCEAVIKRT